MGMSSDLSFVDLDIHDLQVMVASPLAPGPTPVAFRQAVLDNLLGLQAHARILFAALGDAPADEQVQDRTFEP